MSIVFSASRCTPPIPPVTKILIPASEAIRMVDATVVAPVIFLLKTKGISRKLTFQTSLELPTISSCAVFNPTHNFPFRIAIVAGTHPFSLIIFSTSKAVSIFFG